MEFTEEEAGGTCYHNNKKVVTEMHSCSNFEPNMYARRDCKPMCKECYYSHRDNSSIATRMRLYCMYDKRK